jgi:hypothetical protein
MGRHPPARPLALGLARALVPPRSRPKAEGVPEAVPSARSTRSPPGGSTDVQMRSLCASGIAASSANPVVGREQAPAAAASPACWRWWNEAKPDGHLSSQVGHGTPARLMMSPQAPLDPTTDFTWCAAWSGTCSARSVARRTPLGDVARTSSPTPAPTPAR